MLYPKLSEVRFFPSKPSKGFVGFASFVLDNNFYVGNIGVYEKPSGGIRLVYPVKHNKANDKEYPIFYPVNREIGDYITEKVHAAYKSREEDENDRYNA
jgi:DNA-binding cell septation regulator SpoVG